MANPEVVEELDTLDRVTVTLYRTGVSIAAITLLLPALRFIELDYQHFMLPLLALACGLISASVHLYDKHVRWFMALGTWIAVISYPAATQFLPLPISFIVIQGFFYITLSGIAIKESFCFKIPGLKLIPLLLILALIGLWLDPPNLYPLMQLLAGILYLVLAVSKWLMPLHFDIGDKQQYQI